MFDDDPQGYDTDDFTVDQALAQAWLLSTASDLELALDAADY